MSLSYADFKHDILSQFDQKYEKYTPKYKREILRTVLHLFTIQKSQKQSIKVDEQCGRKRLQNHLQEISYAEIKQQAIERERYRKRRQEAAILIQRWIREIRHRRMEYLKEIFSMWVSSFVVHLNFAAWKIQFAWLHWKKTQDSVSFATKCQRKRPIELHEIDFTISQRLIGISSRHKNECGLDASSASLIVPSPLLSSSSQFNPNSPHQIIVTLQAVRNLVVPDGANLVDLKACISLFDTVNRLEKASFDSSPVSFGSNEYVEWEVPQVMTFGIDAQEIEMKTVLMEWVVQVVLIQINKPMRTLARIQVPLALLETSLATEYSLARWFPLAENAPGHLFKGDLRLIVRYQCHSSPPRASLSQSTGNASLNPSNQNSQDVKAVPSRSPTSPDWSPKGQRRPRTWSSIALNTPPLRSRTPSPCLRLKTSVSMPADLLEHPFDNGDVLMNDERRQLPYKSFLKRKPYKVIFRKLDWSKVTAKTNTNLHRFPSSHSSCATSHGTGHLVYLAPQVMTQERKLLRSTSEGSNVFSPTATTSNVVSVDFNETQLKRCYDELEKHVYEKCGVTSKQSISLLKLKYQKELRHFFNKTRSENSQIPVLNPKTSSLFKQIMSMEELEATQFYCHMLNELQ